jgi:hypothetical protein
VLGLFILPHVHPFLKFPFPFPSVPLWRHLYVTMLIYTFLAVPGFK